MRWKPAALAAAAPVQAEQEAPSIAQQPLAAAEIVVSEPEIAAPQTETQAQVQPSQQPEPQAAPSEPEQAVSAHEPHAVAEPAPEVEQAPLPEQGEQDDKDKPQA